jgi:glycerate kinase
MKILIAPDKFKGSLTAAQAADAIAQGLRRADPAVQLDLCPIADGGEGTVDALVSATGGRLVFQQVIGPLPGLSVNAAFGLLGDGHTAVIEMAAASGLHLLRNDQRNPLNTTTYGTGQLLMAALQLGVNKIILGIGGSATTDGGLGCAQACGAVIHLEGGESRTANDPPLVGNDVARVTAVEMHGRAAHATKILVACDVTNPLYGPDGAAVVYGPQKGATPDQVRQLDAALEQLARRLNQTALAHAPGAGAAGGMGFGMLAFFDAAIRPGIDIILDAVRLAERLRQADLCITGEGRLDAQSLSGKAPIGVARLCKTLNVPCIALAGSIADDIEPALREGLTACFSICPGPLSIEEAMRQAPRLLSDSAANLLRVIMLH